ncbi:MAG: FAD:protein FMN transferase [Kiritimatiellales bacterium]|nr:FAD:protein FMN transferase [Kiritimatiellales bacterium]
MLLILILAGCKPSGRWYNETRDLYYGIPIRVSYYPENSGLSRQVWTYLESIGGVFNDYKEGSEIATINRLNATGDVTLSPMLSEAFGKARQAWQLSEGVFDITCAPIRNLWKTAAKTGDVPSAEAVSAVRERCGLNLTEQDGNQLTLLKDGVQFDFGGIIKGMIADHVIAMLKEAGTQSALIQIGGETAAFGLSPKGRTFRIGVQHPTDRNGIWCVIQDTGNGLSTSTSGNYETPIVIDGQEFYHIMDPRTGYPAKTQIVSVSIAFPETGKNWLTDTLSTTGVLLGPEKTFEIVQSLGGEAMFLIRENGTIREVKSPGWGGFE